MWNGIYDWVDVLPEWIDRLRIPPPVHLYLLVVLIVAALPQRSVRPFILYTGLVCLWLFLGLPFTLCVIAACLIIYWITQPLARWAQRSNRPAWPTGIGWAAIHLMFLPCFFITLPFVPDMQPGELTQFCGIGFMVLKASQFVFDSCRGKLPNVRWDQFLTFMTFLPTFRLGPVDTCGHFIDELESCKSRIDSCVGRSQPGLRRMPSAAVLPPRAPSCRSLSQSQSSRPVRSGPETFAT